MIGDRLCVEDIHWKKAREVLPKIKQRSVILIGAVSGAGKTEVADCLQDYLFQDKKQSLVLSLDDYYYLIPPIRNYNRKKQGLDSVGTQEIDWQMLHRICEDFEAKRPIHFKRVHKYLDAVEHNVIETEDVFCLIIEGLYANYLRKENYGDVSVFLEGNPEQTYEFRLKRKKEDETDKFRKEVVEKEWRVVAQLKRYADLIIPF